MRLSFSKFLYILQTHLDLAGKQVRHLAALANRAPIVPYKPEPDLLPEGEAEPEFVIVNRQQMDTLIEQLRSELTVAGRALQEYASAHDETADYWGKDNAKHENNL
jgi:hypothetical protein